MIRDAVPLWEAQKREYQRQEVRVGLMLGALLVAIMGVIVVTGI